jgi:hypothetical protein
MSALLFNKVKFNNIKLSSPDKLDNHYICNLKHDEQLLYVQTPSLSIEEVTQEYILLNINDEFKKFIEDMDNSCIRYTYDNAGKWFKKDIPHDALMNMYENIDTDNGTIRINFPYIRDKLQCKIFNSDRECIDIESLKVGNNIILLLFFKGLKIYSSNFHLDFHINQIKLIENDFKILKEYSIIDADEDNTETIDEYIFKEEINEVLNQEKKQKEELKKQKELELKNKMKQLEEELNNLN